MKKTNKQTNKKQEKRLCRQECQNLKMVTCPWGKKLNFSNLSLNSSGGTCSYFEYVFFMEFIFPACCRYKAVVVYLDATIFPNKAKLYVFRL